MKHLNLHRVLKALNQYIICFLVVGFFISCCMMLFVTTFAGTVKLALTNENLELFRAFGDPRMFLN